MNLRTIVRRLRLALSQRPFFVMDGTVLEGLTARDYAMTERKRAAKTELRKPYPSAADLITGQWALRFDAREYRYNKNETECDHWRACWRLFGKEGMAVARKALPAV